MLNFNLKIIITTLLLASFSLKGQIDENAIKSAYLAKIANNFNWNNSDSIIKIGVLSNNQELFEQIKKYAEKKPIDNKEVKVDLLLSQKDLIKYDIVYIGKERKKHLETYIKSLKGQQTLLFSDHAPSMDNSMVNFYLSFDKKIKFKINSSLLKLHKLEASNLMLILGGSDNEVLTLMEQKDSSLIKAKTQRNLLQEENRQKEEQLKEMVSKIELISNSLIQKNEEIKQKSLQISLGNQELKKQKNNLSKVVEKISKTNLQLQERVNQISIQENKLSRQKEIFKEQKKEIESRNEKIKEQDEFLEKQKSMLNLKEKYLYYAYIFSIFLLGILTFAIISFLGKRKSGSKLIEQNKKLQKALLDLQKAQAQLVQNEKMASLGMLTAGMAHEINNPMTFIYTGVNVLKFEIEDLLKSGGSSENKENIQQVIKDIELGSKRVTEIIRSLQNFSRLNETDIKKVDLRDCIDSTITILGSLAKNKNINIKKQLGNKTLEIECFPASMNQLFVNLISNSIDACEENSGEIGIHIQEKNKTYLISISDNGSGIDERNIGKIFDPFFTTKEIGKGTGLGLSISYNIIKKHFGEIKVKSIKNQGTTFIVELPINYSKP